MYEMPEIRLEGRSVNMALSKNSRAGVPAGFSQFQVHQDAPYRLK